MDPTSRFFGRLKKLAVTVETETAKLQRAFEHRDDGDSDGETAAKGTRAFHDLNCDVRSLKEQMQAVLTQQKARELEVSSFIRACRVMEQRVAQDIQTLQGHWEKYGYQVPRDTQRPNKARGQQQQQQEEEEEEEESDENETRDGENQEEAGLSCSSASPLRMGPPAPPDLMRTPQLSDFGLSEMQLKKTVYGMEWCSKVPPMPEMSLPQPSLSTPAPPPMPLTPKCALRMDEAELHTPQMRDFGISEHTMCLNNDFTMDLLRKNQTKPQRRPQDPPAPPANSVMGSLQTKGLTLSLYSRSIVVCHCHASLCSSSSESFLQTLVFLLNPFRLKQSDEKSRWDDCGKYCALRRFVPVPAKDCFSYGDSEVMALTVTLYRAAIEAGMRFGTTTWYGNLFDKLKAPLRSLIHRAPKMMGTPPPSSLQEIFEEAFRERTWLHFLLAENLESPEPPVLCTPGFKIRKTTGHCSPHTQGDQDLQSLSGPGDAPSTPEVPAFQTPHLNRLVSIKKADDSHIFDHPLTPHHGASGSKRSWEYDVPEVSLLAVEEKQAPQMPNLESMLGNSLKVGSAKVPKCSQEPTVDSMELDGPTQEFRLGTPHIRRCCPEASTPEMPDLSSVTQDICKLVSQTQLRKTEAAVVHQVRPEKDPSRCGTLSVVSESEFQSLPSYLRQVTLHKLNQAVHNINKFVEARQGEQVDFQMEELRTVINSGTKAPIYVLCLSELKRLEHVGGAKSTAVYKLNLHI
ncbi:SKA complex subunit 3 [Aulostomus maculatus]